MRVSLPFKIKNIGGTATFAQNFSDAARKQRMQVSNKFSSDFDVLFIITDCSLWYPLIAKLLQKKIIQRLDGVYHLATPAGKWYWLYNLKMQIIHNFFADTVIYQSKFSKFSCEKFLGKTRAKNTAIIYNGVDTKKIQPRENLMPHSPIKLLTFAKFRRRDQIEPIIESIKLLDPREFSLEIYGSYTENLKYLFENLPEHIQFKGKKDNEELLAIINQYDIFLFSDQSACPNSVLEALAAGLPVIAFDRGSISEIIHDSLNGFVIKTKTHDLFHEPNPFGEEQYKNFSQAITKTVSQLPTLTLQARLSAKKSFRINTMIQKYITCFNKKP